MSLYRLIAYLKYFLRAKKLHGIHSPFVYEFSERVLYAGVPVSATLVDVDGVSRFSAELMEKIRQHYHYGPAKPLAYTTTNADNPLYFMTADKYQDWLPLFERVLSDAQGYCLLICGIHRSEAHESAWLSVAAHPRVLMSIELLDMGLVFHNIGFKEKQHFVLRER